MVHCTFQANIIGWFIVHFKLVSLDRSLHKFVIIILSRFLRRGNFAKSAFETRKAAECVAVTAVTAVLAVRVIGARTVVAIMALKENNK